MSQYTVLLVTSPTAKQGETIARALVQEKLAACVNIVKPVTSVFSWKDKLCKEQEVLLIIKTRRSLFRRAEARIKSLHSYEVPEIIAIPIVTGSGAYLRWLVQATATRRIGHSQRRVRREP